MNEYVKVRNVCRLCGSSRLVLTLSLASLPIVSPNAGGTSGKAETMDAPLDNYLCQDCGLIQLIHVVNPALLYRNYLYKTSISLGLAEHFRGLSDSVIRRLGLHPGDSVAEIGSNDGTLLRFFKDAGMNVQGFDPATEIAAEASRNGIPTQGEFFGGTLAKSVIARQKPAKAILANNVMANIDELDDIFVGIKTLLAPDGAFVFETQYALDVFEKTLLDVIYHEHISCFSVQPVLRALGRYGLELFDAERIATKGGSIRFWVQHQNGPRRPEERLAQLVQLELTMGLYEPSYHARFATKIASLREQLHRLIDDTKRAGGSVSAYGTSIGCVALIHLLELGAKLDFLLDDKPLKERLVGPGYNLPIFKGSTAANRKPGLVIVLAWRYAVAIAEKQRTYLAGGGRLVVPLPDLTILTQTP